MQVRGPRPIRPGGPGADKISSLTIEESRGFTKHLMERKVRYAKHKLRNEVKGGPAPSTIHSYVRVYRSFGFWLCERSHAEANIFANIKPPKPPKHVFEHE